MERIAVKINGTYEIKGIEDIPCGDVCERNFGCETCKIHKAVEKLADYEDAEEQGLLLRLPTNRVWFICDAKTKYATIMSKTIDDLCIYDIKELLKGNSKRYFMTEDEAKQALAKMKEV